MRICYFQQHSKQLMLMTCKILIKLMSEVTQQGKTNSNLHDIQFLVTVSHCYIWTQAKSVLSLSIIYHSFELLYTQGRIWLQLDRCTSPLSWARRCETRDNHLMDCVETDHWRYTVIHLVASRRGKFYAVKLHCYIKLNRGAS